MIRVLVIDDEPLAREELDRLLADVQGVTVIGKCGNALDAIQAVRRERPDALFLDVQMPDVSGFELLAMLDEDLAPDVVFVTAHDAFALKAFEKNAVDYLLKPVEPDRLAQAVDKLRQRRRGEARPSLAAPEITRIPCLAARAIKLVSVSDVEFVRSGEEGVFVVTAQGTYFTELTLNVLETRAKLLRCHRQYLVNVDRIDEISLGENSLGVIKTKSGEAVPVSRRHLTRLRAALGL